MSVGPSTPAYLLLLSLAFCHAYSAIPHSDIYNPMEVVDFQLMSDNDNSARSSAAAAVSLTDPTVNSLTDGRLKAPSGIRENWWPAPSSNSYRGGWANASPLRRQTAYYNSGTDNNFGRNNRYDLVDPQGDDSGVLPAAREGGRWQTNGNRRRLPLLSRGVRELDDLDDNEDWLLAGGKSGNGRGQGRGAEMREPSCKELRRMWRIARRIHQKAIETNRIPQSPQNPFSDFESERFRTMRRFRSKNKNSQKGNKGKQHHKQQEERNWGRSRSNNSKISSTTSSNKQGAKEEMSQELSYGSVRYSPSDPVKRPRDPVQRVYDQLKGVDTTTSDTYRRYLEDNNLRPVEEEMEAAVEKEDEPVFSTGVRYREPASSDSSFDSLHSQLRVSQGMDPREAKERSTSRDSWGELQFFQEKPRPASALDMLRDRMKQEDQVWRSRLNYRDEQSSPIRTAGVLEDSLSSSAGGRDNNDRLSSSGLVLDNNRWEGKKSLRRKVKNRKKIVSQLEKDILHGFRSSAMEEEEAQRNKSRKKFRNTEFYKNLLLKGK